jgi:hypothetical protein
VSTRGPTIAGAAALPLNLDFARTRGASDSAFEQLYASACPKVYAFVRCQVASGESAQGLVS